MFIYLGYKYLYDWYLSWEKDILVIINSVFQILAKVVRDLQNTQLHVTRKDI